LYWKLKLCGLVSVVFVCISLVFVFVFVLFFKHGILKKVDCLKHKSASTTTLYVKADSPQPPTPTPAPPQWEGSWALQDRYNHFLCFVQNYGALAPPSMPSYCGTAGA
jgi:hypothetical protein